jgi:hypothetical protein
MCTTFRSPCILWSCFVVSIRVKFYNSDICNGGGHTVLTPETSTEIIVVCACVCTRLQPWLSVNCTRIVSFLFSTVHGHLMLSSVILRILKKGYIFLSSSMTEPYVVSGNWKKSSGVVAIRILSFCSYTLLATFLKFRTFLVVTVCILIQCSL